MEVVQTFGLAPTIVHPPCDDALGGPQECNFDETITDPQAQGKSIQARLADVARQEEKRRRLLEFLQRPTPAWDPLDHPEIEAAGGAAAWVRKMRDEAERAFQKRTRTKK